MQQNYTNNERELIRLTKYFRKRAGELISDGKLTEEQKEKIVSSCENLEKTLSIHAGYRESVIQKRENLANVIRDNASCPNCGSSQHLKHAGVVKHEKGWKSNRYKCRKCNIEFTWNRPNNPWDMIPYIEDLIDDLKIKVESEGITGEEKSQYENSLQQAYDSLDKLRIAINSSDEEYNEMEARDKEMAKTVHEFKNYLAIEKIRLNGLDGPE